MLSSEYQRDLQFVFLKQATRKFILRGISIVNCEQSHDAKVATSLGSAVAFRVCSTCKKMQQLVM